jgi:hypothetical protein
MGAIMSAPSILAMNRTVGERELLTGRAFGHEPVYYWQVEQRTARGWKFIRDFHETKTYAAGLWNRLYRKPQGTPKQYRYLRSKAAY